MKNSTVKPVSGLIFKLIIGFILSISPVSLKSQSYNLSLMKDIITDSVFCTDNSAESYSLFLPGNYEGSQKWPLLFIFDPAARGRIAVDKFVPAAKKFGYILVCSNTIQNGDFTKMLSKADVLYKDVMQRFSIDSRRIFSAGFSGGSRLALAFSVNNRRVAGVIGCGAGMPDIRIFRPSLMTHLIYFGIVGDKDMNYQEMNDLSLRLINSGILSYFMVFNGGHNWPEPENLQFALGWMELQLMKKGVIEKRDDFINDFLHQMTTIARQSEEKSDLVGAKKYYSYVLRDFPVSQISESLLTDIGKLEKCEPYKKAIRYYEKIHDEELLRRQRYQKAFLEIVNSNELTDSICNWWKNEIHSLDSKTRNNRSSDSLMSYRLLNMIASASIEYGSKSIENGNYKAASGFFKIWTICDPDKKNSWYNLARVCALDRQNDEALFALERSVKNGLHNKELIKNDTAFKSLQNQRRFIRLIQKIN